MENKLANWLARYSKPDELEYKKMALGIKAFFLNAAKLIVIYTLAVILDTVLSTLIIQAAFVLIKRYSLGLHALSNKVCTAVSCFLFVIVPWVLRGTEFNNIAVIAVFIPILLCLVLYAPADTKARPLIGKQLRDSFKRKAVFCGFLLMGVALLIPNGNVKFLLSVGAAYQTICILPLTYKILKRSVKNYEAYEQRT